MFLGLPVGFQRNFGKKRQQCTSVRVRLDTLFQKLKNDPKLKMVYRKAVGEYIDHKVVKRVHDPNITDPCHKDLRFLPHRAVYNSSHMSVQ